jgi:hypothetical protein
MKKIFVLLASLFVLVQFVNAQGFNAPAPSPLSKISQKVGLAEVNVTYSRPSAKKRTIFGDIVPFGKVWRTGANSPTKIKFDDEVLLEGNKVPAGEYSLLTIPNQKEWTILINKDSKGNGAFTYQESDDVVKFNVKSNILPQHVETFTITFVELGFNSAHLEISWEKTSVRFKIEHKVEEKINKQIEAALNPNRDAGLYYQIASYYHDTNQKTPEAIELIKKSNQMRPRYWTLQLQAKLEARNNDFTSALATLEKSTELAAKEKDDSYVNTNNQLKQEWSKKKK